MAKKARARPSKKVEVKSREEFSNQILRSIFEFCKGDATILMEVCANVTSKALYIVKEEAVFADSGESPTMEFLISNFAENLTTFSQKIEEQLALDDEEGAGEKEEESEGETDDGE